MTQGISRFADIAAIEAKGFPQDLPNSTYELLQQGAAINPQAPALSFFLTTDQHDRPTTWTYADLLHDVTRTANAFSRLGATQDTVIAFVLPNLPETHFVVWGGQAAGTVFAINPLLEGSAIAELIEASGASILVTLAPFPGTDLWPKLQAVLPRLTRLQHLVLVGLADRVPGLKRFAARWLQYREARRLHGRGGVRAAIPAHLGLHDFTRLIRRENGKTLDSQRQFSPDDYSSFFCTGGTTGLPKIAMRRHRNEVANAWSAAQFLGSGIGPGKVIFCGLPLFHVNGVLVTGLLPFSKGAHVILGTPQGYRGDGVVKRFWEIVAHHRVNFFSGVPTLYAALLDVPVGKHDISSLEYGLCGAAPMPVEVFRIFQERTGLKILEGYGLTEGTCVSSVNPPLGERHLGSIGLRIPGQQMKTVVLDDVGVYLRDAGVNEVGVVVIRGPNVFAGYLAPEQNKGLWLRAGEGDVWLNTGDLGRQDAEGYFWLTGRKKELIIRGGHNIDPAMIEAPLHEHPAVQIAAAVGRPDAHAGELPVAYVQLKPGQSATEAELLAFAQSVIGERAAWPKQVRVMEQMPLTAVGKIFKPTLKQMEARHALTSALSEAGIEVLRLDIVDDKSAGMRALVSLAVGASAEQARQVLGRFTIAFDLN